MFLNNIVMKNSKVLPAIALIIGATAAIATNAKPKSVVYYYKDPSFGCSSEIVDTEPCPRPGFDSCKAFIVELGTTAQLYVSSTCIIKATRE